jgi:hypothetical protein
MMRLTARMLIGLCASAMPMTSLAATPAATTCSAGFVAPAGSLRFSRELRRSLFDGKELVVTRHYRITFAATPKGTRVEGSLTGTDVEVPERLAALADLERKRQDDSMFPLMLDSTGRIVESHADGAALSGKAQPLAEGLIAGAGLDGLAQEQAARFVESLFSAQGPGINQWPAQLFRPGEQPSQVRQELPLPGGGKGAVTITLEPVSAGPCGLMQRLERRVETLVGTQVRRTREIWTLGPDQ